LVGTKGTWDFNEGDGEYGLKSGEDIIILQTGWMVEK